MKYTGPVFLVVAFLASSPLPGFEVYHWVDENGVSHYSQDAPPGDVEGVDVLVLEDTTPADYDPEADLYGVEAQAERMALLREEMQEKREAERERRREAAANQPVVPYQQTVGNGYPWWGLDRPGYPVHPIEPPPIAVPYRTHTFAPPGPGRN